VTLPRTDDRDVSAADTRRSPTSVIFDLDGTLLDTIDDMTDAVNAALKQRGCPTRSVEEVKYLVGEGTDVFARGALPAEVRQPDIIASLIDEYRAEYAKVWTRKTRPYPGIVDLLNDLDKRGIPMAVLSNKRDAVVKEVIAHFLPGIPFADVQGARPGVPLKPDATAALLLAHRIECSPQHVLFVGDTKTDMQTARAADMVAVGALWGFRTANELRSHGAQHLIDCPADILALEHAVSAARASLAGGEI
jgi:phosphoglycolate phosphatase